MVEDAGARSPNGVCAWPPQAAEPAAEDSFAGFEVLLAAPSDDELELSEDELPEDEFSEDEDALDVEDEDPAEPFDEPLRLSFL